MVNYIEFLKFELLSEYNHEKFEEYERNLENMSQKEFDDIFDLYNLDLEVVDNDPNLRDLIGECNNAVKEKVLKKAAYWRYKFYEKHNANRRIRLFDMKSRLFSENENSIDIPIGEIDLSQFGI